MAIFDWPASVRPQSVQFGLKSNTGSFTSPLSGVTQTTERPGAVWTCSMTIADLRRDEIAELEALIARLAGRAHKVRLWHHARETPRGTARGTGNVSGGGQVGGSLKVGGFGGGFKAGDFISVDDYLYMVVEDGSTTLIIVPPLRSSPASGAIARCEPATGLFRLDSDSYAFSYQRALAGVPLNFVEAL